MNKQNIIPSSLILSVLFLLSPLQMILADTASTTPVSAIVISTPKIPAIIQEIKNAKEQLATVKLNYDIRPVYKKTKAGKKVISTYQLYGKDVALAILNPSDGSIKITMGTQSGKSMLFQDPNFDIKLNRFNGVNSSFVVNTPANGTVLALKYLITGPETGSQKTITSALSESIYVPYSLALSSPEVIAYGQSYLDGVIKNVTNDLRYLPSQAIPGKDIVDAIKPELIKSLVYAEHSNASEVLYGNPKDALDKLNILFATNEADTYKYSVSTAGARGIAQFIPSTYSSLVARHPEAGLIADFASGMSNHRNAIKAMYMLIDDYAGAVRVKASQGFAAARVFDYGAASYNGGTARVAKAVDQFGDAWNENRNSETNSVQSQINSLTAEVRSLKSKVKSVKDAKAKASLQSQLASAQNELATNTEHLDAIKSSTLRDETITYLQKIYKVIPFFG